MATQTKSWIILHKASKSFRQGETISGSLEVEMGNQEVAHEGITIHLDGHVVILRSKMRYRFPRVSHAVKNPKPKG